MGYLRRVRISGEKGASQGRHEKEAVVTVYALYCFDGNAVWTLGHHPTEGGCAGGD